MLQYRYIKTKQSKRITVATRFKDRKVVIRIESGKHRTRNAVRGCKRCSQVTFPTIDAYCYIGVVLSCVNAFLLRCFANKIEPLGGRNFDPSLATSDCEKQPSRQTCAAKKVAFFICYAQFFGERKFVTVSLLLSCLRDLAEIEKKQRNRHFLQERQQL